MTAQALLRQLTGLGVRLSVVSGRLRLDAPAGVVTPELRATLAQRKGEILAALATPEQAAELRRLVPEQCRRYNEPDAERCLRDALADPENALAAYRLLASQTIH